MSIAVRSVGTRSTTAPGVPAGTTTDDIVLMVVDCNLLVGGTSPSCSGFTLAGIGSSGGTTGRSLAFLIKRATGPESGTYALTAPASGSVSAAEAFAFSGVTTAGTYYTTPNIVGAASGSTATPAVSITDSFGDARVWGFATAGTAVTISSVPAGYVEISPTGSSVMHTIAGGSAGGASGSLSMTMSASSNPRVAGIISLIAPTTVDGTVNAPAATAAVAAPAPAVSGTSSATVTAVVATTALAAPAPVVSGQLSATVAAVVATAALAAPAPTVAATRSPTVAPPAATIALAAPAPRVDVPLGALVEYNADPLTPEAVDLGNYDLSDTNKITVILDFVLMDPADSGAHVMLEHSVSSSANNGFVLFTESIFATPSLGQLGSSVSGIGRDYGDYTRPTTAVQHRMVWTIDRTLSFAHDLYIDGAHITLTQNATYNVAQASTPFGNFHLYAGGRAGGSFPAHVKMNTPKILHHIADSTEIASYFQADATTAAVKATIATAAPTPIISAAANILAAAATVASVAIAPSVTATRSPTVAAPASTITLAAPAPVVAGQRNATTTAVPATITIGAPTPLVTTTANPTVTSPAATITLLSATPSIAAGGSVSTSVPAATIATSAPPPAVTAVRQATVSALPGTFTTDAAAPVVSASQSAVVTAPAAACTISSAPPVVSATRAPVVNATAAVVMVMAPTPVASGQSNAAIVAAPAVLSLDAQTPAVAGVSNGTVAAAPAELLLAAPAPTVRNGNTRDVTVLSVTEVGRPFTAAEHQRAVAISSHPRRVTIKEIP